MTRPICEYCAKPYGERAKRTEMVFCPEDPKRPNAIPIAPKYFGNAEVLRERYLPDEAEYRNGGRSVKTQTGHIETNPGVEQRLASLAKIKYVPLLSTLGADAPLGRTLYREVWVPGDYRTPYEPFCTLRCARDFALSAHRAGYRIVR